MSRARSKAIRRRLVRLAGDVSNVRYFQLALLVQLEEMNDGLRAMMSYSTFGPVPKRESWRDSVRIPRSLRRILPYSRPTTHLPEGTETVEGE